MPLPSTQFAAYTPGAAAPVAPALAQTPPATNLAAIQPGYRETSVAKALPAPAADDNLPGASQILDRWKDSGKPLR